MKWQSVSLFLFFLLLSLAACSSPATVSNKTHPAAIESLPALAAVELPVGEKLRVVATTNLVADVARRIGGDTIDLIGLLPPGADPHGYQATPNDLRAINDAHLILINGLGLEESLDTILSDARSKTVAVNTGVATLAIGEETGAHEEADAHQHDGINPHTWWSIAAVEQWSRTIEQSLSLVDPAHAAQYGANAQVYRDELSALKAEVDSLVAQIPLAERKLATDHDTLAYFAHDYGFQVVGLIVPSSSSLAEPSAQHLAQLQDQIRAADVRVIFVGSTVNPRQAEQLAQDLGIRVVPIYTDSLSAPDGPAPSYVAFMRYNVNAIVQTLANP